MENFPSIQNILNDFINHMEERQPISASDLPNIDLYMDQVTTFMNSHLEHSKRYPEDKILTKTMINNYAKTGSFHRRIRRSIPKITCFF